MNGNPFQRLFDLNKERQRKAQEVTPAAPSETPAIEGEKKKKKKTKKESK